MRTMTAVHGYIRSLAGMCLLALTILATAPAPSSFRSQAQQVQTKECTVYVTRTGAKYHMSDCYHLRKSRRPMARSEAIAAGYTPCKHCGGSRCER